MNKNDKSELIKVLEQLARLEERISLGFKNTKEDLVEIKKSIRIINEEMGALERRVARVENLYFEAKLRYDKMSIYWKAIALILSPLLTFGMITLIKMLLGLPPI